MLEYAVVSHVLPKFEKIASREEFGSLEEKIYSGMNAFVEECKKIRVEEYIKEKEQFNERARKEGWGFFKKLFSEKPQIKSYVSDKKLYKLCVDLGLTKNLKDAENFIESLVSVVAIPHTYGNRDDGITILKEKNGIGEKRYYVLMTQFGNFD